MDKNAKVLIRKYAAGLTAFAGIMVLAILCLSYLLLNEILGQGSVLFVIYPVVVAASMVGAHLILSKTKGQKLQTVMITGAAQVLLLVLGGLLMEGKFCDIGGHLTAICCGCVISCIIHRNKDTKKRRIKRPNRYIVQK